MKHLTALLMSLLILTLTACGASQPESAPENSDLLPKTTIYVDIAASMSASFQELLPLYAQRQPNVTVALSSGSSGTLMTQIQEADGFGHDLFFSAGTRQVTALEEVGLVAEGTVTELLSNRLCLVTGMDSDTAVADWEDLPLADNMALCDGTVPVGKYSREALVKLGFLPDSENNAAYSGEEVSAALGGVEINECADAAAAAQAVAEGSNEVGTVYYTDWYGYQDELRILAQDDGTLTGPILYPVCQIVNAEADEAELAAAEDFLAFLNGPEALAVFEAYGFSSQIK